MKDNKQTIIEAKNLKKSLKMLEMQLLVQLEILTQKLQQKENLIFLHTI